MLRMLRVVLMMELLLLLVMLVGVAVGVLGKLFLVGGRVRLGAIEGWMMLVMLVMLVMVLMVDVDRLGRG